MRTIFSKKLLKGFTLVELIVVITILAILATVGFLALSGHTQDARDSAIKANVRSLQAAITSEAAVTNNSPRYYVVHDSAAALSGAFVYVDGNQTALTGGDWNQAGTNYSAGNPDYAKLKLNPEKFRVSSSWPVPAAFAAYDSKYLSVGAMDVLVGGYNGNKRPTSWLQVAGVSPTTGAASVSGNFPAPSSTEYASGAVSGLVKDPLLGNTGAVTDGAVSGTVSAVSGGNGPEETVPEQNSCSSAPSFANLWTTNVGTPTSVNQAWTYSSTPGNCTYACLNGYSGTNCAIPGAVAIADPLQRIEAGAQHTCAITSGTVKCWGRNANGQIGDGTTIDKASPTTVSWLSGVVSIASSANLTCALTNAGGVKCWGQNSVWQIGNGFSGTNVTTPTDAVWLTSWVSGISVGTNFACASLVSGGVKCWGNNAYSSLGNNSTTDSNSPVSVSGLETATVKHLASWTYHSCAAIDDWSVKCWWYNMNGSLGDGTTTTRPYAVSVSGISSWAVAVAAGTNHACALTSTGWLLCWWRNSSYQLGDGTVTERRTPVPAQGFTEPNKRVMAVGHGTCSIGVSGAVYCWWSNANGQIGDNTTTARISPFQAIGSGALDIWTSDYHTCAILDSGTVKCWWNNNYKQLWDGTTTLRLAPITVSWF